MLRINFDWNSEKDKLYQNLMEYIMPFLLMNILASYSTKNSVKCAMAVSIDAVWTSKSAMGITATH